MNAIVEQSISIPKDTICIHYETTMKYGRYFNKTTNEYVNRFFLDDSHFDRVMNKANNGGWEPFPKQKVFISFCEADRTYMGALRNRLISNNLLSPLVVEARRRPSVDLTDIIPEAINDSDYFVAILSEKSVINQWVNQEIGYAFAVSKLDGKRFAFVESKLLSSIKGFFHDKMQQPYQFKHRSFPSYYRLCETFITEREQDVIKKNDFKKVNT